MNFLASAADRSRVVFNALNLTFSEGFSSVLVCPDRPPKLLLRYRQKGTSRWNKVKLDAADNHMAVSELDFCATYEVQLRAKAKGKKTQWKVLKLGDYETGPSTPHGLEMKRDGSAKDTFQLKRLGRQLAHQRNGVVVRLANDDVACRSFGKHTSPAE